MNGELPQPIQEEPQPHESELEWRPGEKEAAEEQQSREGVDPQWDELSDGAKRQLLEMRFSSYTDERSPQATERISWIPSVDKMNRKELWMLNDIKKEKRYPKHETGEPNKIH